MKINADSYVLFPPRRHTPSKASYYRTGDPPAETMRTQDHTTAEIPLRLCHQLLTDNLIRFDEYEHSVDIADGGNTVSESILLIKSHCAGRWKSRCFRR